MRKYLIRAANRAHSSANPMTRRAVLVSALAGLAVLDILFWASLPLLMLFVILGPAIKAAFDGVVAIPRLTFNQAVSDAEEWARNWAGACRIWRAQKADA